MKNLLWIAFLALGLNLNGAHALEVGDISPCMHVDQVLPDGTELSNECVNDPVSTDHKYTLLDFSSTTCYWCSVNHPNLVKISQNHAATTTVRVLYTDRNEAVARKYLADNKEKHPFPVGFDPTRKASKAFGIPGTPTMFVVDRGSKIIYKHVGVLTEADMAALSTLLSQ